MTPAPIKVGDRVAYAVPFLKLISCLTGPLPHARGEVVALTALSADVVLAAVRWEKTRTVDPADVPGKVNVANLCRVGGRGFVAL